MIYTHRLIVRTNGQISDVRESFYRWIHKWYSDLRLTSGQTATVEHVQTKRVLMCKAKA